MNITYHTPKVFTKVFLLLLLIISIGQQAHAQIDNIDALLKELEAKRGVGDQRELLNAVNNVAFYYWNVGNGQTALKYFEESVQINNAMGNDNGKAHAFNYLGVIYSELGNINQSISYLKKSVEIRRGMGDKNGLTNSLLNLGITFHDAGRMPEAITTLEEALNTAKANNAVLVITDCYSYLSKIHEKQGNEDKALEYQKLYMDSFQQEGDQYISGLKDQFETDKNSMHQQAQVTNLELEKREKEIEILKLREREISALAEKRKMEIELLENKAQLQEAELKQKDAEDRSKNILLASLGSGLLMFVIIAFVLNRAYEQKKKANTLLKKRQIIIEKQNDQLKEQNVQISESKEKIKSANEALKEKNKELIKLYEDKNALLRIVADDLRHPLKHIELLVNIIRSQPNTSGEQQNIVEEITKSTMRLNSMITKMLLEAEIDAKDLDLNFNDAIMSDNK